MPLLILTGENIPRLIIILLDLQVLVHAGKLLNNQQFLRDLGRVINKKIKKMCNRFDR